MLHALNLNSDVGQTFLNKLEQKIEWNINNFSNKSSFVLKSLIS